MMENAPPGQHAASGDHDLGHSIARYAFGIIDFAQIGCNIARLLADIG